jgi:hypothetical protein
VSKLIRDELSHGGHSEEINQDKYDGERGADVGQGNLLI